MFPAVLLLASVLGASVYYWQHNKELSYIQTLDNVNPHDIILPRYEMHPIILNSCFWPNMKQDEDDILQYLKSKKRKRRNLCKASADVEAEFNYENSSILLSWDMNSIRCFSADLNSAPESSRIELTTDLRQDIPFPSFVVECHKDGTNSVFRKSYLNPRKTDIADDEAVESTEGSPSIAVLYLKSMSRSHFQREFLKTTAIMRRNNFFSFAMFNKISNNVSETVDKTFTNEKMEENIGSYMKKRYCKVLTNDPRGRTSSNLNLTNWSNMLKMDTCADENTEMNRLIEEWARFSVENREICHFSHISLDNGMESKSADESLSNALEKFQLHDIYKKTIIVILSAEGIPVGHFGNSYTGRVEERNPILMIHMPETMAKIRPDHVFHLEQNQNRLITHLDVFETLRSFSRISKSQGIVPIDDGELSRSTNHTDDVTFPNFSNSTSGRGISLWQSLVPKNRTCLEALIPDEFCLCMENKLEIEARYNRTYEMTSRVYELMETQMLSNYSCLSDVSIDPEKNATQVFNLNNKVLEGADSYVEFFKYTVRTWAKTTEKSKNRVTYIDVLGQFKHFLILEDGYRIEQSYPYALVTKGLYCMAGFLERFCDMCHERSLASA